MCLSPPKEYTKRTKITDFSIIWVKIETDGKGGWKVRPRKGNKAPDKHEVEEEREKQRALQREETIMLEEAAQGHTTGCGDGAVTVQ